MGSVMMSQDSVILVPEEPVYHEDHHLLCQKYSTQENYGALDSHSSRRGSESTIFEPESALDPRLSLKAHLLEEVPQDTLLSLQLLTLTFCTGIIDAMTLSTFRVFCSKQTGNTIVLALIALGALGSTPSNDQLNEEAVLISFSCFFSSAILFGWAGNLIGRDRRLWLFLSTLFSTTLVLAAATLHRVYSSNPSLDPDLHLPSRSSCVVIALLASACGGQLQLALSVRMPELNTTMITAAIVNLASDPRILAHHNSIRNRRAMYWVSMLAGAFLGAVVCKASSPTEALWLAAGIKVCVGLSFLCNKGVGLFAGIGKAGLV